MVSPGSPAIAERFGHSAVVVDGSMFVIGGYNGAVMLPELLSFVPENCTLLEDEQTCINQTLCMWNENACTGISLLTDLNHISLDCNFGEFHEQCSIRFLIVIIIIVVVIINCRSLCYSSQLFPVY